MYDLLIEPLRYPFMRRAANCLASQRVSALVTAAASATSSRPCGMRPRRTTRSAIIGQSIAPSQVAGALLVVATVVWLGLAPRRS